MADRVVLGLRAHNLQETLLHELASVGGAYAEEGLDVEVCVGSSADGLGVGVASSLFEHAEGGPSWEILLVACVEPLFWLASSVADGPRLPPPLSPTVQALLQLAARRADPDTGEVDLRDPAVLGPGAAVGVATGSLHPRLDIGALARFPAIGVAARPDTCDPEIASRVARAHRSALHGLHDDDRLVATVLQRRYDTPLADVPALVALLRGRFRATPSGEARATARAGLADLGRRAELVDTAFAVGGVHA